MQRTFCFLFCLLVSACNPGSKKSIRSIQSSDAALAKYPEACFTEVPATINDLIAQTLMENTAARDKAVAAEQSRLGVKPLKPTTILGEVPAGTNEYKPKVDPFPASVVAIGNLEYDIRKNGYQLNHGQMGKENVYETARGSGQYFIVDLIDGDGIGGNGGEVIAYSVEYGLRNASPGLEGHSWHSWHVSDENVLIRATQKPEDKIIQDISICGCGDFEERPAENDKVSSIATPSYDVAIFMLPAATLPRISTETFQARYPRSYVKQRHIAREGKTCQAPPDPNQSC